LEFAIASNTNFVAEIAWWVGFSFTSMAIFCIFGMVWMRIKTQKKKAHIDFFRDDLEKILYQSIGKKQETSQGFWKIKARRHKTKPWERFNPQQVENNKTQLDKNLIDQGFSHFLFLWNYLHESLRGESKIKLNHLANDLDLTKNTQKLLQSRNLQDKIIGIETLGNLANKESWEILTKFADDKNPIISLWTVKALFRIDKDLALQHYFSMIAKREDWSPVLVAKLLKELTSDFISKPLSDLVGDYYIKNLPDRQMARVISYLSLAHVSDYSNLIAQIMSESNQQEILIACLRLADSEQMLPRIRKLAKDDRWQVRMQVVLALGRLGEEEDVEILVKALNDIEWWVRYRAACALTSMPFMTEEYLIELSETLPNEFARDIVKQVLAEIDLQCQTQPSSITLSR
jgi:glycosyltransferase involved in cell wall biosynthesis